MEADTLAECYPSCFQPAVGILVTFKYCFDKTPGSWSKSLFWHSAYRTRSHGSRRGQLGAGLVAGTGSWRLTSGAASKMQRVNQKWQESVRRQNASSKTSIPPTSLQTVPSPGDYRHPMGDIIIQSTTGGILELGRWLSGRALITQAWTYNSSTERRVGKTGERQGSWDSCQGPWLPNQGVPVSVKDHV